MDRKTIIFLIGVIALTIVVFNNIVQLIDAFKEKGFDKNLSYGLILVLFGTGFYSLINYRR